MPSTLNPNMPGGLEQIIMHAMALEPADRYDTASAMLRDLDEFRKNPGILFDYNVPPLDDVIHIQRPPLVLQPEQPAKPTQPKTIAEKTVEKKRAAAAPPPRRPGAAPAKRSGPPARTNTPTNHRKRDPKEEERNKVATTAIIVCSSVLVLAILVFLGLLIFGNGGAKPEMIQVPYLIGEDFESLETNSNYVVKLGDRVHDSEYAAGLIIEQSPAANTEIKKGETIYVTVSLGEVPATVTMPNLDGWELPEAERAIDNLNMNLKIKLLHENHEDIPKDSVIRTNPALGTVLATGQEIELVVSLGVAYREEAMIDVVGKTKEEAEKMLKDLKMDLELIFEEVFNSKVEEGCVVSTNPEKELIIATGDPITIYISKGAQMIPMSKVLGMNVNTATDILKSDGFTNCTYEWQASNEPKETVIGIKVDDKEVKPGDDVDAGKTVVLLISSGPRTVTIQLQTTGAEESYWVTVYRDSAVGEEVFRAEVAANATQIQVENQTGTGTVRYYVDEEGLDEMWVHTEDFSK